MSVPESAVDRWLLREGWFCLGWTVNREMVRRHDKVAIALLAASPFIAIGTALATEPVGAVAGLGTAVAGLLHFGISKWANWHPEVRDRAAPRLSHRAHKMLKKLVKATIGTDLGGQKYNGKIMRPSAEHLRKPAKDVLQPVAFAAFEPLAFAYNRVAGACAGKPELSTLLDSSREAWAEALDWVAQLNEYPESANEWTPRVDRLTERFTEIAETLEAQSDDPGEELRTRLAGWSEVLRETAQAKVDVSTTGS